MRSSPVLSSCGDPDSDHDIWWLHAVARVVNHFAIRLPTIVAVFALGLSHDSESGP